MTTTTQIRERPILFSAPMVRAILDGRKTQTRRVIVPQPKHGIAPCHYGTAGDRLWVRETWAPGAKAGNRQVCYAADGRWGSPQASGGIIFHGWTTDVTNKTRSDWAECNGRWVGRDYFQPWKPSIHMPRWASRITLEITGVRVERLKEITEDDARAEGFPLGEGLPGNIVVKELDGSVNKSSGQIFDFTSLGGFRRLWDSLNANRGHGWDANPWVWVIEFKRLEQPQ